MPLLEINQTHYISASVRLDESTAAQVDQYAAFIHASADDVVTLLEVRRRFEIPVAFCRARAREIAQTAQRMIARRKIA